MTFMHVFDKLYACRINLNIKRSTLPQDHLQSGPKQAHSVLYILTSSNIDRFSKLFHCQNQENICHNTVTKDPTTPQVCR